MLKDIETFSVSYQEGGLKDSITNPQLMEGFLQITEAVSLFFRDVSEAFSQLASSVERTSIQLTLAMEELEESHNVSRGPSVMGTTWNARLSQNLKRPEA